MYTGWFVGRVGGLAMALGVGVALAGVPAVALAEGNGDGSSSSSAGSSSSSDSSTATGHDAAASGSAESDESPGSARSSTTTDDDRPDRTALSDDADPAPDADADADADADGRAPDGTVTRDDDEPADFTAPPVNPKKADKQRDKHEGTTRGQPAKAHDDAAEATVAAAAPDVDATDPPVRRNVASPAPADEPSHPQTLTPTRAETVVAPLTRSQSVTAQSIADPVDAAPAAGKLNVEVDVVGLATVPQGPLTSGDPAAPAYVPTAIAALAAIARPRAFTPAEIQDTASPLAAAAPPDPASVLPTQPTGVPDPVTGVVHGVVQTGDPGGSLLTYTIVAGPARGTVELDTTTGAYSYTATDVARLAAGATTGADTDSFVVAVADGQQTLSTAVTVYISPLQYATGAAITTGRKPAAMVVGADGRMYVANSASGSVSVIDTTTGRRVDANPSIFSKNISVGSSPSALVLSADGKRLYVANAGSRSISVIDTTTYKRIDANPSIFSKNISVGSSPSALVLSADGKRLYVANRGSKTVSVINTETNSILDVDPNTSGNQSISVESAPVALALKGTSLYVANRDSNTVSVIEVTANSVTKTLAVGRSPVALSVGPVDQLYVANSGDNSVSIINTTSNTVVPQSISVSSSASSVAFSGDGALAFVTGANSSLSVIDTVTGAVVSTASFDTDKTGGHVVVGPGGTVYIADTADNTVRTLSLVRGNTAPIVAAPIVGSPDPDTGAVTVTLEFTDPDGDSLGTGWSGPTTGNVEATDGIHGYTFTPSQAARDAAAGGGPESTTFTIEVTDGRAVVPVNVTVPILATVGPTTVTVVGAVTLPGSVLLSRSLELSPDGTRALAITGPEPAELNGTTRVSVIDTTTGRQTGSTFAVAGRSTARPLFSSDGSRAVITTNVVDANGTITRVTVLNLADGTQSGTFARAGVLGLQLLGADGGRALIETAAEGGISAAVINTSTGTQIGRGLSLDGPSTGAPILSTDGSHALLITSPATWEATGTTRLSVLDLGTGNQVGDSVTVVGNMSNSPELTTDGRHALTATQCPTEGTTRAVVLDLGTGRQDGVTVSVHGIWQVQAVHPGAGRVLLSQPASSTDSVAAAVFSTADGAQIGATLMLAGVGEVRLSPDKTLALIRAVATDATTGAAITRSALLSTSTGTQVGSTATRAGQWDILTGPDNNRAIFTREATDPTTGASSTLVSVVNPITGAQIGTSLTVTGAEFGSRIVSADGSRALIVTHSYDGRTSTNTARLTLIDTTTGHQLGTPATLTGFLNGGVQFNSDTDRAVVTTISSNFATTGIATTQVAVINTKSGNQTGTTLTLPSANGWAQLSADGTTVLLTASGHVQVLNAVTGNPVGGTLSYGSVGAGLMNPAGTRAVILTGPSSLLDPAPVRVRSLRIS